MKTLFIVAILLILVQIVDSESTTASSTSQPTTSTSKLNTSTSKSTPSTTTVSTQQVAKELQGLLHDNSVTLFSKTYCPYSKKVKKILAPYEIKDLKVVELDIHPNGKMIQDELEKISKLHTVPQLFVNGKFVGNYDMISKMEKKNMMRPMLEKEKVIKTIQPQSSTSNSTKST